MSEYLKKLVEDRQSAYHAAKEKMDEVAAEGRDLSAEERAFVDRTFAELDEKRALIDTLIAAEQREAEIAEAMRGMEHVARPVESREATDDAEVIRSMLTGELRSFEFRTVLKTSTNAPVPTDFASQVVAQARAVGPMLNPSIVNLLTTDTGNDLVIPTQASWSTATQISEAGTVANSDPGFGSITLKSYKSAVMVPISAEMARDSSVDILGFIAEQAGQALGYQINSKLTLGTGTVEPKGIVPASATSITGGTGVSGAFTGDNLIDLVYSVDGAARILPGFGFLASTSAVAAMRKLKTTDGQYLWQPALVEGQPDRFLGYRVVENPHMAAVGTSAVSVLAGDLRSFIVRSVGGLQVAVSDDYGFNTDTRYMRFIWYVDSNLGQSSHIKRYTGGTA